MKNGKHIRLRHVLPSLVTVFAICAGMTSVRMSLEGHPEAGLYFILLAALLDARMTITIEGSQAAHGVYMLGDGGAMLILQSPDRFYNPHHEWARLIGMGYGTIIGTPDEVSFHMNPSEVLAMADRLEASPRLTDL